MTDHGDTDGRTAGGVHEEEDLLGPDLRALLSTLPKELPPETDLTTSIAERTWDSREKLPGVVKIASSRNGSSLQALALVERAGSQAGGGRGSLDRDYFRGDDGPRAQQRPTG